MNIFDKAPNLNSNLLNMHVKGFLTVLAISLLLLLFGYNFLHTHYVKAPATLNRAQRLVNEGKDTLAILDTVHTELTRGGRLDGYAVTYTFIIDSTPYHGRVSYNLKAYIGHTVKVTYLPYNPGINSADAKGELKRAKEAALSKGGLYMGYAFMALAVFTMVGHITRAKQRIKQLQPPGYARL